MGLPNHHSSPLLLPLQSINRPGVVLLLLLAWPAS